MGQMSFRERDRAESFGAVAALYDQARPSYPPALFDLLLGEGAADVLDIGCGTGIAAASVAARGCRVLGVEIDARMAEIARAKGLEVEVASFEGWDDAGRRFDVVMAGQAWHWIDPQAGAQKAARVLRDRGRIGLFWNLGDPPPQLRERLSPVYSELEPELKNYSIVLGVQSGRDRESADGLVASGRFEDVEVRRFPWRTSYDTEGWLSFLITHSDHATLPPPRRERLLTAVGEAIDAIGGSFEVEYSAILVTGRRTQPEP
jgi:SAM-dependent methyltransferase